MSQLDSKPHNTYQPQGYLAAISDMSALESHVTVQKRAYYSPPWADVSIIAVAGSSGSGKSTVAQAIVRKLNLPWVVILSMA